MTTITPPVAQVTLTSRPGGISVQWHFDKSLSDLDRTQAAASVMEHAKRLERAFRTERQELPAVTPTSDAVQLILTVRRVPGDVVTGALEAGFISFQRTRRSQPGPSEVPRPAAEILSRLFDTA